MPAPHTQALGWHSWRARASLAASPTSHLNTATTITTLAEAHALLNAASHPAAAVTRGTVGSLPGEGAVVPLEGTALAQAQASPEFAALRAAVEAKDSAVSLAWGAGRTSVTSGGRRGWRDAFPPLPVAGLKRDDEVNEWRRWVESVNGSVEGMEGVLVGVVEAVPSLHSSLEEHLKTRFEHWVGLIDGTGVRPVQEANRFTH